MLLRAGRSLLTGGLKFPQVHLTALLARFLLGLDTGLCRSNSVKKSHHEAIIHASMSFIIVPASLDVANSSRLCL